MPIDEEQLAELFTRSDAFAELEREIEIFCPFEAVGMADQEIRHAYFLKYIFDPERPHGFGTMCLRAFLKAIAEAQPVSAAPYNPQRNLRSMDVHLLDLKNVTIRREWRRIDLLIELRERNLIVAIELKINAKEHGDQLAIYKRSVESEWPMANHLFVYLTKHGDDPESDSKEHWIAVGLDSVLKVLRPIADGSHGNQQARAMLAAYLEMMGRRHLGNERLEELAIELWAKHREVLEFLTDRQPSAISDIIALLIKKKDYLAKILSEGTGLKIICEGVSGSSSLRFAITDWDNIDGMRNSTWTDSRRFILVEIRGHREVVGAYIVLGRGDAQSRSAIYDKLLTRSDKVLRPGKLSPEWKRLASTTLFRLKADSDVDSTIIADKVQTEFVKAMSTCLIAYNEALTGRG